jgi:hypothetical protein
MQVNGYCRVEVPEAKEKDWTDMVNSGQTSFRAGNSMDKINLIEVRSATRSI